MRSGAQASAAVKPAVGLSALLLISGLWAPAFSQVTMTFEGLKDDEQILNYYNGGLGGLGSGPGPNYGVVFGSDALALIEQAKGGSGNFQNEPSLDTIAFFVSGPGVVMNVAAGFTTGFSFYYAAANNPGTVTVYDGLSGTGTVLATLNLPVNGSNCNGSAYTFSCWSPKGVAFSGTARSVNFGGVANQVGFDNITIGSATPGGSPPASVPALSPWVFAGLATLMAAAGARLLLRGA